MVQDFDLNVFSHLVRKVSPAEQDALDQRDWNIELLIHTKYGLQPASYYEDLPLSYHPSEAQIEDYHNFYGKFEALYADGQGAIVEARAAVALKAIQLEAAEYLKPLKRLDMTALIERETWTAEEAALMISDFKPHPRALDFCWREQEYNDHAARVAKTVRAMWCMPNPPTSPASVLSISETVLWARGNVLESGVLDDAYDDYGRPARLSKSPIKRLAQQNQRLSEKIERLEVEIDGLKGKLRRRKFDGKLQLQALVAVLASGEINLGELKFSAESNQIVRQKIKKAGLKVDPSTLKRHIESGVEYLKGYEED